MLTSARRNDDGTFRPSYDPATVEPYFHDPAVMDQWDDWEDITADILLLRGGALRRRLGARGRADAETSELSLPEDRRLQTCAIAQRVRPDRPDPISPREVDRFQLRFRNQRGMENEDLCHIMGSGRLSYAREEPALYGQRYG